MGERPLCFPRLKILGVIEGTRGSWAISKTRRPRIPNPSITHLDERRYLRLPIRNSVPRT